MERSSSFVSAWEKPSGEAGRLCVWVESTLPLVGRLIAYEGIVTRIEA
jgi:hypothetical protein